MGIKAQLIIQNTPKNKYLLTYQMWNHTIDLSMTDGMHTLKKISVMFIVKKLLAGKPSTLLS